MMDDLAFVSQAKFAKMHDVSAKTVSVWKQAGRLVMTVDGRVNVKRSDELLATRSAKSRGGVTQGPNSADEVMKGVTREGNEVTLDFIATALAGVVAEAQRAAVEMALANGCTVRGAYFVEQAAADAGIDRAIRFLVGTYGIDADNLPELYGRCDLPDKFWKDAAIRIGEDCDLDRWSQEFAHGF